jgi:predicted aspartyl protease
MNQWRRAAVLALLALVTAAASAAQGAPDGYRLSLTRGSRLMIAVKINGRTVNALLDSAAEATIVDHTLAQAVHLDAGRAVVGHGSGRAAFGATLVSGVTLEALGLSLPNQTVAVADLSDVGRRLLGRPLDVILGREIFDAARLSIDIEGRRIRVVPRDREPPGMRLGLETQHGVETIAVRVEAGTPTRATFDLGNGSEVLLSTALALRMRLLSDGRPIAQETGGGLGGETSRQIITLRSLEVAGRQFKDVPAAIDPQASASDVNIGVAILRHFQITTDFAQHALWLDSRG